MIWVTFEGCADNEIFTGAAVVLSFCVGDFRRCGWSNDQRSVDQGGRAFPEDDRKEAEL
jgi:hypothetical protein